MPKLVFKSAAGPAVLLCGDSSETTSEKTQTYDESEFVLFVYTGKSPKPVKIYEASALDHFQVHVEGRRKLVLREQVANGSAVLTSDITCNESNCSRSEEHCDIIVKEPPFPHSVERVRAAAERPGGIDNKLISELISEAVSGDSKALALLESTELRSHLDGAYAEARDRGISDIQRLKRAGCLAGK